MHTDTLQRLKQRVKCTVVVPGDGEYDKQRTPWLEVVNQLPLAIVNAEALQDIIETIRFVRENGLPLAVQNTGHGIASPCNSGVLLRLSHMKAVTVDAKTRTATVEPGVQSGELLAKTEPFGLAYPAGQVSNVGAIGYTLGGGVGWLARKLGAACHAVQSATLVLADGSVVTASAAENPDLFWAIRGGGGNFGVVASLTVGLTPLRNVFGGMAYYRMEDAPEVLRFYRQWTADLSENTSTVLRLMQLPPKPTYLLHLRAMETCAIGICHADEGSAETLHEQLKRFKAPVWDDLKVLPYSEMSLLDQASNLNGSPTYGNLECLKGLSDSVIDGLAEIVKQRCPPLVQIELQHLGGALNLGNEAASYTAPQAPFFLHFISPTIKASLHELSAATKEAYASLGPVFTGEVSYNFLRGDQQDRVPAAFGSEKYARLQGIKKQYDPTNLFRLNMNIPPS